MEETERLFETLKRYNEAYRSGKPLVSDHEYDSLAQKLRELDPAHPFLHVVEPEKFEVRKEVRHPVSMLSTEKAYTKDALARFVTRVKKDAGEIGVTDILFKVTPKLDGLAARDDGNIFATRGNGEVGYEISNAFKKGVIPVGGRGLGLGEIVIVKSYFDEHLSGEFEHPRNMVVGIVASDTLNVLAKKALQDEVVRFVPYAALPVWNGRADELVQNIDNILSDLTAKTDYPTDGVVAEVTEEEVKKYMGSTAHHYRWQIAYKTKGETAITIIKGIRWQVGRTGNITPVLEICPVSLSGATIRRVTAHNAGLILKKKIGINAEVEVIRSGEVIPKLEKVIKESDQIVIPDKCPSCNSVLEWSNDFLKCNNDSCKARIEQSLNHWFKVLGNADWFGIKTIQRLVDNGYDSLEKIYAMSEGDFFDIGFGPVQSKNLAEAINTSKNKRVEDWRFLAAFGISDLGNGDSKKLLSHIKLEDLVDVKAEQIEAIHGFGAITSLSIENGIARIKDTMSHMLSMGFNLDKTLLAEEIDTLDTPIAGKGIVFTGKMLHGNREEIQAEARSLGARVQSSVTGKTNYLVCGEKAGAKKIAKAKTSGSLIISETDYLNMIKRFRSDPL
ncbi:MAG: DNA ligase [Deltaproteobacteria bacterium]|nr:DNA ligase [Deltaproteobacteria bacterium]MBW2662156.1 DNA ligase [Deltaproteobacteria bacterium]